MGRADGLGTVNVRKPVPYVLQLAAESASAEQRSPHMANQLGGPSLKKKAPRKKPVLTGVWPCKINGCNKQFAREADLKRHQRTTKLHSMPSFSCPQCDANFTRTDALRRHQKSRHNGVVIDPPEREKDEEDDRCHSGTPSSKGKEKAATLPVPMHQGAPTHLGPSSYYRSHTVTVTPYMPPQPQSPPLDPNQANPPPAPSPSWPAIPPSWQNGTLPPNMGPIGYLPMYYHPSPHYRPHTSAYHTGHSPPPPPPPHHYPHHLQSVNGTGPSSASSTSRNSSSQPATSSPIAPNNTNIDPTLETEGDLTEADVVAAVQAVLLQAESEEAAKHERERRRRQDMEGRGERIQSAGANQTPGVDDRERETMGMDGMHGYISSLARPEPMEHILTEDGEPMLNPAELLTQESLASPPPS